MLAENVQRVLYFDSLPNLYARTTNLRFTVLWNE